MNFRPLVALVAPLLLAAPFVASAVDPLVRARGVAGSSGLSTNTSLTVMIGRLIGAMLGLLGVVFLLLIIYAGYLYLTSGGEDKKAGEAKTLMKNAIIGLIIVMTSYAIAGFVINTVVRQRIDPTLMIDPNDTVGQGTQPGGMSDDIQNPWP